MEYRGQQTEGNLYHRIATGGPETVNAAIQLLSGYGYPQPTTRKELYDSLTEAASVYGEGAVKQIVLLHPDREIILANAGFAYTPEPTVYHNMINGKPVLVDSNAYKHDCGCQHHKNDCGCQHHRNDLGQLPIPSLNSS